MSREPGRRAVAAAFLTMFAWRSLPADPASVERGRDLFRIYCASCHGAGGRGDGPDAAGLGTRPPDLTVLARDHGGTFPEARVRAAIDGRASHRPRSMPAWGFAFQDPGSDAFQEAEVERRIGWLTELLRSIQAPAEKASR